MAEDNMKEIKIDESENVVGGAIMCDGGLFRASRFRFSESDIEVLKEHGISGVKARYYYQRSDLNSMGISGDTNYEIIETLKSWGISVMNFN